jgi:hypothetical protein
MINREWTRKNANKNKNESRMRADDWQLRRGTWHAKLFQRNAIRQPAYVKAKKADAVPRRGKRTQPRVLTLGFVLVRTCPESGIGSVSFGRVGKSISLRLSSGATFLPSSHIPPDYRGQVGPDTATHLRQVTVITRQIPSHD